MSTTHDAIIVGARVAGAATAMLLARKGYRVLLLDRTRFPADIPHGHLVHRDGPRRLRDWGVLERLVEAGTPPVAQVTTHFGDFPLTATELIFDNVAWGYGARRRVLDQLLLAAAVAAGAELREGFTVEDVITDRDRVNGITGRSGETRITERAAITIGADGRRSHIARLVGAAEYDSVPTVLCYYFSYWSGVAADGMEIHHLAGRAAFAHPTTDGLYAVFIAWPIAEFQQVRSDIERHFAAAAMGFGTLGERLSAGRREEKFYGAADLPNVRRKPFGPGWALVGDAGYHKDPYMALGISDALRDAELARERDRRWPGGLPADRRRARRLRAESKRRFGGGLPREHRARASAAAATAADGAARGAAGRP